MKQQIITIIAAIVFTLVGVQGAGTDGRHVLARQRSGQRQEHPVPG